MDASNVVSVNLLSNRPAALKFKPTNGGLYLENILILLDYGRSTWTFNKLISDHLRMKLSARYMWIALKCLKWPCSKQTILVKV